jgi:hypothetical protein
MGFSGQKTTIHLARLRLNSKQNSYQWFDLVEREWEGLKKQANITLTEK